MGKGVPCPDIVKRYWKPNTNWSVSLKHRNWKTSCTILSWNRLFTKSVEFKTLTNNLNSLEPCFYCSSHRFDHPFIKKPVQYHRYFFWKKDIKLLHVNLFSLHDMPWCNSICHRIDKKNNEKGKVVKCHPLYHIITKNHRMSKIRGCVLFTSNVTKRKHFNRELFHLVLLIECFTWTIMPFTLVV